MGFFAKTLVAVTEEALASVLDGKKWIDPSARPKPTTLETFEERSRTVTA